MQSTQIPKMLRHWLRMPRRLRVSFLPGYCSIPALLLLNRYRWSVEEVNKFTKKRLVKVVRFVFVVFHEQQILYIYISSYFRRFTLEASAERTGLSPQYQCLRRRRQWPPGQWGHQFRSFRWRHSRRL